MIRPLTGFCCLLAVGAVLYTYQSKHEVQLLDRQIEKTLRDTAAQREQSRALRAEWTLRENPERLRLFADQYLSLKPVSPNQFTTLADLNVKLPQPRVTPASTGTTDTTEEPDTLPGSGLAGSPDGTEDDTIVAEELPIPPLPVPPPPVTVAAILATPLAALQPAPQAASASLAGPAAAPVAVPAVERRSIAPRPAPGVPHPPVAQPSATLPALVPQSGSTPAPASPIQAARVQPARTPNMPIPAAAVQAAPIQARAQPVAPPAAQPVPAPQPVYSGSLLGMAHGGSAAPVPLPRPMPVSTTQWSNGN